MIKEESINSDLYGSEYYKSHCGTVPYVRNDFWLAFFGAIADRIISSFRPTQVYDAGCALGFLAESLWDRGVECWGQDISEYAISQLRSDMQSFCKIGSITEAPPGPERYDLVTCIEVVEHMPESDALLALDRLTSLTSRILFSSSPTDFAEITHINVRPTLYWLKKFADRGFLPDWAFDATFVSPHAFSVSRQEQKVSDGELRVFAEWIRVRSALIEREQRIGQNSILIRNLKDERDTLAGSLIFERAKTADQQQSHNLVRFELNCEITRLQELVASNQADMHAIRAEARIKENEIDCLHAQRNSDLESLKHSTIKMNDLIIKAHRLELMLESIRLRVPDDVFSDVENELVANFAGFDPFAYLNANPDVSASGSDPLEHWLVFGRNEGRRILSEGVSQLTVSQEQLESVIARLGETGFSADAYTQANPDITTDEVTPEEHWIRFGQLEGRRTTPLNKQVTDAAIQIEAALQSPGELQGNQEFDPAEYLELNPDIAQSGVDPLQHWTLHGRNEGRAARVSRPQYSDWIASRVVSLSELEMQRRLSDELLSPPLLSIITPVFRVEASVLDDTIRSVVAQSYPYWELCLAVADTSEPTRMAVLQSWSTRDTRVKIRLLTENFGISGNSNAAFSMANGVWTVLLDHDDTLSPDALFQMVKAVNAHPDIDFVYSDKDQISADGLVRMHPLLKPAWSPDIMLSANYLTHLNMMRTSRVQEVGGWDHETDGAQDWDLFLRVIGEANRVLHVPKILYHWRQVATSVAAGGTSAKPYALKAQLQTLNKYLTVAGWQGAEPTFEDDYIRIKWPLAWRPSISVLLTHQGTAGDVPAFVWPNNVEVLAAPGAVLEGARVINDAVGDRKAVLLALMSAASGDIVVMWDSGLVTLKTDWLSELVGPLSNPNILAVSGAVLFEDSTIDALGAFLVDGKIRAGYRGLGQYVAGPFGSPRWYSNASITPLRLCAMRRETAIDILTDDLPSSAHRIVNGSYLIASPHYDSRILLNPFSVAEAREPHSTAIDAAQESSLYEAYLEVVPGGETNINPSLTFAHRNWLTFRTLSSTSVADHNFTAEARYAAASYSVNADNVARSKGACLAETSGPMRSVCWVVPEFNEPFYGGVHTILRAANYMYETYGVVTTFCVLGQCSPGKMRSVIARAFPRLAQKAAIQIVRDTNGVLDCGSQDAAVCTLWTTAYPLLRTGGIRRKFYFVQDWEPLFYPAGSVSGLVESTYRFGFHAICNTISLAKSYMMLGGTADHFNPAVDGRVFHRRKNNLKRGPFRLFCYARPTAPRNCFELLTAAMKELKDCYGTDIDIITAGAYWDPKQYGLDGVVRHLGLLAYEETGLLYRGCDAGLVAMATRHPSYLPFELMASGAVVVTNRNPHTEWLLRDGQNCVLCELTRQDLVRGVRLVIEEIALREQLVDNGYRTIEEGYSDWDRTCETIYEKMNAICLREADSELSAEKPSLHQLDL